MTVPQPVPAVGNVQDFIEKSGVLEYDIRNDYSFYISGGGSMATKKLGNLIKKARTDAGLTQEELAKKVGGLSAADIGKAERAEKDLTTDQLKAIAKATGVTQKSLLDAAGKSTASASSSKTSSAKSSSAKSSSAKSSSAKTSSGKTASSASGSSMKLTANEKKLVELYREADAETKKQAMKVLKGEGADASDLMKKVLGSKAISNVVTQMIKNSTK